MPSELQAVIVAVNANNTVANLIAVGKYRSAWPLLGAMVCAGATGLSVDLYRQSRAREHAR